MTLDDWLDSNNLTGLFASQRAFDKPVLIVPNNSDSDSDASSSPEGNYLLGKPVGFSLGHSVLTPRLGALRRGANSMMAIWHTFGKLAN